MVKRILIIDDEYDIRSVAQLALTTVGGWEVETAESGMVGMTIAIERPPDAILLDVMMPDMDGIATLHALQANPSTAKIPVILLTAKAQAFEQRRFAELNISGIITKPFKVMQLPTQVSTILHWV